MPPTRKEEVMDRCKSRDRLEAPSSRISNAWSGPVCPDAAKLLLYASDFALRSYQPQVRQAVCGLPLQMATGLKHNSALVSPWVWWWAVCPIFQALSWYSCSHSSTLSLRCLGSNLPKWTPTVPFVLYFGPYSLDLLHNWPSISRSRILSSCALFGNEALRSSGHFLLPIARDIWSLQPIHKDGPSSFYEPSVCGRIDTFWSGNISRTFGFW